MQAKTLYDDYAIAQNPMPEKKVEITLGQFKAAFEKHIPWVKWEESNVRLMAMELGLE